MRFYPASVKSAGAPSGRMLLVILAAYIGLAVLYNAATPIFEASDEFRHFLALQSIVRSHQLSLLAPSDDPLSPGVEAGQPPLYYLLGGAVSGWVDAGPLPGVDFNPHVQEGIPSTDPDNKNLFVHSPAEAFPYHGLSLAVHLERLLSVLLGAGTVWLTFLLAEAVAPGLPAAAPLAASLVAFNPQFLFISASVDNDNLITCVSTAALVVMARMLCGGLTSRGLWLLSGLLGVAMLSKLSGLALPVLALGVVVFAEGTGNRQQATGPNLSVVRLWRRSWRPLLILATGPLVIAGWWYVRNWLTYGDPTGLSAWLRIYGGERGASVLGLLHEAPGLFISYWGVFGGFDLRAGDWLYAIYLLLMLAGLVGLVFGRRKIAKTIGSWAPMWLLAGWFGLELAALVRWTSITTASTGRLLFPAISAVAALLAVGLLAAPPGTVRPAMAAGIGAGLFGLAVFVPVRYLLPAYAPPVIVRSAAAVGAPSHGLDITYGDTFRLLGYDLAPERAKPRDEAVVDLYWQVLKAPETNYSVTVQLLSGEGSLAQYDSLPGEGKIAARTLTAGDYFRDRYPVQVNAAAPAPILGRLLVAMYDQSLTRLPAHDSQGAPLNDPIIGELPVDAVSPVASASAPLAVFGGQMQLVADQLPEQPLPRGSSFDVKLRWRAAQRMDQNYTVFIHLTDADGKVVAQHDQQPRGGSFPTSWWARDEIVNDSAQVALPSGTPPGRYQVLLGAYELGSLQRLKLATGADSFSLGSVEID